MATGDVWRFSFEGTFLGSEYVNVWHARFKSEAATPGGFITGIKTTFYDSFPANVSDDWALSICRARKLSVPALLFEQACSVVGSNATDQLPPQSALVITLRTGIAGRSRRGRLYLGGFIEAEQAGGTWTTTLVSNYQGYINAVLAAYGSGGEDPDYEWGVWSRVLGGEDPGPYDLTAGFRPITAAVVRPTVYTQRRRVAGVGR